LIERDQSFFFGIDNALKAKDEDFNGSWDKVGLALELLINAMMEPLKLVRASLKIL
jgi:hypothetical protein